jgi:transposase-like protein
MLGLQRVVEPEQVGFYLFPRDVSGGRQISQDLQSPGANVLIDLRRLDQAFEGVEIAIIGADQDSCAPRFAETPFKAEMIRGRVTMTTETAASGGVGLGRGGRMSRQRKRDAVLRLLRGEDLETLSRALGATAATLTGWQDTFVAAGEASLATRSTDGAALETERLKAKRGEMLLERELLEAKIAALEANRPLARRRSRP